jgi:hypothetical protein
MRRAAAILLVLMASALPAWAVPGAPPGWAGLGSWPQDYEFGTDAMKGAVGKQAAYIKARPEPKGYGAMVQCIKADKYLGQRLRFAARLKTVDAARVQLLMRVDGPPMAPGKPARIMSFYNMADRPLQGTTDWQSAEVVLDVPAGSINICYGFMLAGKGEAWADGLSLTRVGLDVPVSRMPPPPPPPTQPSNLGFER